jgi:hypothetical protein
MNPGWRELSKNAIKTVNRFVCVILSRFWAILLFLYNLCYILPGFWTILGCSRQFTLRYGQCAYFFMLPKIAHTQNTYCPTAQKKHQIRCFFDSDCPQKTILPQKNTHTHTHTKNSHPHHHPKTCKLFFSTRAHNLNI